MTSSCEGAREAAIKPRSMARNISCAYRTVGSVGEHLEQLLCWMIEPAPWNSNIQFENICCLFFQHSWKLSLLHLLLPKVCSGCRVKILEICVYSLLGFLLCEVFGFRRMDTSAFIRSLCKCLWDLDSGGFFASLSTSQHFKVILKIFIKMCSSAFFYCVQAFFIYLFHSISFFLYITWNGPKPSRVSSSFWKELSCRFSSRILSLLAQKPCESVIIVVCVCFWASLHKVFMIWSENCLCCLFWRLHTG